MGGGLESAAEWVEIDRLKPWEKNPRKNQPVKEVMASIKRFGFGAPVIARKADGEIIAGHTRVAAARELGIKQVPVRWMDLEPADARLLALADNRLSELADWDPAMLQEELNQYDATEIELAGWSQTDLNELASELERGLELEDDEALEPPANPVTKPGDLWVLGSHRLLCGDSTKADDVARLLDGATAHLMVTDPPYGVEYDPEWRSYATGVFADRATGKVTNDHSCQWPLAWSLWAGDVAYVWHSSVHAVAVAADLSSAGFEMRNQLIWGKGQLVFSRGHYHWQHEPCWYAVRKGRTAHWHGDRSQSTLWNIDHRKSETGHSTQKPIECMGRPIRNSSKRGDGVYDPFVGSGTTLVAAEQLERRCYAMEIDPGYCDVVIARYEQLTGKKAERIYSA